MDNVKVCNKCLINKPLNEFYNNKKGKLGKQASCKICCNEIVENWLISNKEKIKIYKQKYFNENKKNLCEYIKKRYDKLKADPEFRKQQSIRSKKYWKLNKEFIKERRNNLLKTDIAFKEKVMKRARIYQKTKRDNDSFFKLKGNLRSLIKNSFLNFKKGKNKKKRRTEEILGCSFDFFIIHLTKKFKEGMNLDNYGKWEIDHIIPLSSAKTEQELIKLNHFTNLQPLPKTENRKKSNKIISISSVLDK